MGSSPTIGTKNIFIQNHSNNRMIFIYIFISLMEEKMETWDILDENGNLTGKTMHKSVTKLFGKRVFIILVQMYG